MPFSPDASRAPNPFALALSVAELGLAPFWKNDSIFGRETAGRPPCLAWFSREVGLPLAPCSHPATSSRVPKTRAAPALQKGSEEEVWALMGKGRVPPAVAVYLQQKGTSRLVPGELCSPQKRRKELGLDFLPPRR